MAAASSRYGVVAIGFHWVIAAAICTAVPIGWTMADLPLSPRKLELYALHKSIGLTVLFLALMRLAWRLTHRPPPPIDGLPPWQHTAALWGHRALYALIVVLPLSGWLYNSVVGFPLSWFGWVTLPPLAPAAEAWRGAAQGLHWALGWVLIVTVLGHAGAALHHHFVRHDRTLWRMLPILPGFRTVLAVVLLMPVAARAADWTVDPAASTLRFRATQGGAAFEGGFARWQARIAFDPADPAAAAVTATIDIASIGTGAPDRDRELPKPDWFDLARFPQAVFEAHGFTAEGAGAWLATGTLTIRDHAVPVALPFTLTIGGDGATMDGKVELDRTSFGIGQGDWAKSDIVGKAVTVIVHIVAKRG